MENSTADAASYAATLKKLRRRRACFFATVVLYIPALLLVHRISPTHKAMGTLFAVWIITLIIVTSLVALCRCPRCGNYFHLHGMTLLVLRRCLHCQFHVKG